MSWNFVYQELKSHLEDKEFVKKNLTANPNNPDDAIVTALYHLSKEYIPKATKMCKEEYGL